MSDLDRLIEDSLREADRTGLVPSGEPGYFRQAFALFTGRLAWVHWVMFITQFTMFVLGAVCAWHFFQAETALTALHWGFPAAVLLIFSAIFKTALAPEMATNRLLMEIKRLELRIERLRAGDSDAQ